jgi:formylglycine-generating enzyme required for sulfatase activity
MSLHLDVGVQPITGYTLIRLLGRGGFGEVWEACAPGDFHVALKFLRLEMREASVEQRALEVIRRIRHGHLLDVQFTTRVADCLMIAMPLCDQSLLDRLRACQAEGRPGVPRNELLRYMDELARAVDYLNEPRHLAEDGSLVGIQHRDIKPHNIFLMGGSVRLADFGLAKILAATAASAQGSMSPHYAAPEVIQGKFSRWSDQYSLAATYFELRSGRPLFQGENALQIIYAHVHTFPELTGLVEAERAAVARALAKRPEERWPTCRAFVHALILGAREDDRRMSESELRRPPDTRAEPGTRGFTNLQQTQQPPPIPSTRIDDGSPSGLVVVATAMRDHWLWVFSSAVVIAGLAAVLMIPRSGGSPIPPPGNPDPPPTASTKPPERAASPRPSVPAPAEPPKANLSDPGPIAPSLVPEKATKERASPAPVEPTPAPFEPPKEITNTFGMKLVLLPAGEFPMGSPDSDPDAYADEKPQHRVRITRPFYMGATEVTQGQYQAATGANPSQLKGSDDLPVETVSWLDAINYCNALSRKEGLTPFYRVQGETVEVPDWNVLGYRLPTEAEWEYACRAGSTTRYSFGDRAASLVAFASYYGDRGGQTHPVGQKRPNALGLYDMHGNVWEWCWDGYEANYYSKEPTEADPLGPSQAASRVNRGGSWDNAPQGCRSAVRSSLASEGRFSTLGFRVARVQSAG